MIVPLNKVVLFVVVFFSLIFSCLIMVLHSKVDMQTSGESSAEITLNYANSDLWFIGENERQSINTCYNIIVNDDVIFELHVNSPNLEVYSHPWIYRLDNDTLILRQHLGIKFEMIIPYNTLYNSGKIHVDIINEKDSTLKMQYIDIAKKIYQFSNIKE